MFIGKYKNADKVSRLSRTALRKWSSDKWTFVSEGMLKTIVCVVVFNHSQPAKDVIFSLRENYFCILFPLQKRLPLKFKARFGAKRRGADLSAPAGRIQFYLVHPLYKERRRGRERTQHARPCAFLPHVTATMRSFICPWSQITF